MYHSYILNDHLNEHQIRLHSKNFGGKTADQIVVMAKNPGRITEIITVDLPRPRTIEAMDSKLFIEYRRRIRGWLMGGN